ncbi:MAG: response regulator [bacterium]
MANKQKILIVEDSKSYLLVISQKLEEAGFLVVTAENGEEGLTAVKKESPDLILLDVEMPIMDGITMAKKLKESNSNTPIIFLTNMSDMKHISDAVETASDYIIKSELNTDDIVNRVKERLK